MKRHSIGIIGYGHFGAFVYMLLRLFAPQVRVRVYAPRRAVTGRKFCSLADVCASDAVVMAVPIAKYKDVLLRILPLIRKDTIIVDVATVKVYTVQLLRRHAKGRRWLAIHPMFGPESFRKARGNVRGFRIALCAHSRVPAELLEFLRVFVTRRNFMVVRMGAHVHDRHGAASLFRTHYLAQVARRDEFCRTVIDTVSFGFLMDAFESVWHDKRLFRDVYKYNRYCEEIRMRIKRAMSAVDAELRAG